MTECRVCGKRYNIHSFHDVSSYEQFLHHDYCSDECFFKSEEGRKVAEARTLLTKFVDMLTVEQLEIFDKWCEHLNLDFVFADAVIARRDRAKRSPPNYRKLPVIRPSETCRVCRHVEIIIDQREGGFYKCDVAGFRPDVKVCVCDKFEKKSKVSTGGSDKNV